ncbi:interleukin-1 receptor-like 1 [Gadus chalcogrammus]|uniref:interleukin-1 receptor-like 1 n=1 Tax=Gadus chalcogrammus TaxID=1042646 RepID=UPI0024C21190|nr:interleukin-1 receptor-like 1 [Gadus chalcogrammus]
MSCQQGTLYMRMISLLVLLLGFSGVTCSCDLPDPLKGGSTCENYTDSCLYVLEGEAVYIASDYIASDGLDSDVNQTIQFTWRREKGNTSISSSEEERIHHHGPALLFLPIYLNDSDLYIARWFDMAGKCHILYVPVKVGAARELYTPLSLSDTNPKIPCPEIVKHRCKAEKGVFSWDQNSTLMPGEAGEDLQLLGVTKADSALYTCRCTWRHMEHMAYNTTASRNLFVQDKVFFSNIQIIHPTTQELMVHPGYPLSIKCKALIGTNVCSKYQKEYQGMWEKNNHSLNNHSIDGYWQNFSCNMEEPSKKSFITSTLIIDKVQESDLKASFRCRAKSPTDVKYHYLTLKRAESLTSLLVALMCVSAVFLLATTAIKYFAVDLVLFSRRFLPCTKARNDGLQYDVYVVYQSEKVMEEILSRFLFQALLQVLEQKCGFRVFIHGRDAIPGEDRLRQVEERVMLSRRLMVVLTPGSEVNETLGSSPSGPPSEAVDWQIGLHHALLQEMRVILVQLGDMGPQGYTHLSPTLQHLVRKSAPLCWREDSPGASHWNSRFWKRVRYAMPSAVAKPSSSVV